MLNFDKYREQIDKWLETEKTLCNFRYALEKNICPNMMCEECKEDTFKWLFTEYEQPLLENGDELKPGDWIMVRNDDDSVIWYKNRFVCYYNATFFVVDDIENDNFNENGTNITGWKYARLPEDGE